jgi:hypothetical protein
MWVSIVIFTRIRVFARFSKRFSPETGKVWFSSKEGKYQKHSLEKSTKIGTHFIWKCKEIWHSFVSERKNRNTYSVWKEKKMKMIFSFWDKFTSFCCPTINKFETRERERYVSKTEIQKYAWFIREYNYFHFAVWRRQHRLDTSCHDTCFDLAYKDLIRWRYQSELNNPNRPIYIVAIC